MNLAEGHGEYEPCCIFGVCSLPSRALGFHILLEDGAQFARLPIHAFCWKPGEPQPLEVLQMWDCLSYHISVTEYSMLKGLKVRTILKDRKWYPGSYLFTIDWAQSQMSEDPGEGGHKCAHIIKLDNGNFAAQPNNRILWQEPSFITRPLKEGDRPRYRTNSHVWRCETESVWCTEHSDLMHYDTKDQSE
jgi:hypothetical protein